MIVSIDHKFSKLKKDLNDLGIETHDITEGVPSNAYIYSEETMGFEAISSRAVPSEEGALLINGDGRGLDEIVYMLNNKVYSPLFNHTYNGKDFV